MKLSWRLQFVWAYPNGWIDVLDNNTVAWDNDTNYGVGAHDNLFYFNSTTFITFCFNAGGQFRVDDQTISNSSMETYDYNAVLELAAIPANSSVAFQSFSWDSSSSSSNPYDFTTTQNQTVWCIFAAAGGLRGEYIAVGIVGGFIFFPCCILLLWILRRHR